MRADCITQILKMLSSFKILLQQDLFGCVAGADTVNDKVGTH